VKAALQYFHVGGERHTLDEEESLFPRLLAVAPTETSEVIERLRRDHGDADDLHASVDWLYTAWISAGTLGGSDQVALLAQTTRLKLLYADHILVEESDVFPRAALALDSQALADMGLEFSSRRK
jgi:hypothetical protein